ncbi:HAD hydrolase-like protein [Dactylosporangium sp. AC04546]|uniref:HAD family hydrolase n=1 Tax=Dactylosporangium sp. AC04546 TaxID=2862460 RepID=UPI001EDF2A0D|nr:HAD hydrolase-like protein [Dactylosporangium sp. AC04546]WVK84569.1 HAD hydrolase-like protein [Dactylosporangium sp. AC04546]
MKHLVWDWNGTLLDDLKLVVDATNVCLATVGGPVITAEEHRRDFRRPILDYYAYVLQRPVDQVEFQLLDDAFHDAYRLGMPTVRLVPDALDAMAEWPGTQSLLSMFFHDELLVEVERHGLTTRLVRVDGLPGTVGGHLKAAYLERHLAALAVDPADVVLIGDSVDDGDAARAVGASCVLYAGGFTDVRLLEATGLPVAHSLVDAVSLAL